jgi:hypothetical protein
MTRCYKVGSTASAFLCNSCFPDHCTLESRFNLMGFEIDFQTQVRQIITVQ